MTWALSISLFALIVRSSGSPGPEPTRYTFPFILASFFCKHFYRLINKLTAAFFLQLITDSPSFFFIISGVYKFIYFYAALPIHWANFSADMYFITFSSCESPYRNQAATAKDPDYYAFNTCFKPRLFVI